MRSSRASALIEVIPKEDSSRRRVQARSTPISVNATPAKPKDLRITYEELERANTEAKAWLAVRGNVYDMTNFLDKHPGGKSFLIASTGRDVTAFFESMHSEKNAKVLNKYKIGTLVQTQVPQYSETTEFATVLEKRVRQHFAKKGINPRNAPQMLWVYSFLAVSFGVSYFGMAWQPESGIARVVPWIAALMNGWTLAMMGFYYLHDSCHGSFTSKPWVWNTIRRIYEALTGLSTLLWYYQHGLGHHPYTNVLGADPDVIVEAPGLLRQHEEAPWYAHYGFQKYYWLPLYSQLILSRKLTEWKNLLYDQQFKHIKLNPITLNEKLWIVVTMSIYVTQHFLVPYFYFGLSVPRLVALYTVCDLTWSLYLMLIFQASHINSDVAWPKADKNGKIKEDWAVLQIEASLDFAHDDILTTFLCGTLNYQAVHHVFPFISQYYYPEIAPIVKDTCKEYGVRYNLKPSIWSMISAHMLRLNFCGEEPVLR